MGAAGAGEHRVAGGHVVGLPVEHVAAAAGQHVVDLVLVVLVQADARAAVQYPLAHHEREFRRVGEQRIGGGAARPAMRPGLLPGEVMKKVYVGDLVSFANQPLELAGDVLSGHTLDNRASIAALTICLEELQNKPHIWDVWAVATVQEEVSYLGAYSSAFELRPQMAIVVDGSFAKGPGANGWQTFGMGKGVGLCIGPNMHPFLHKKLKELAERLEIPWFLDVTTTHSGTDAFAIQVTAEGIPTGLVEFPIRYMHTPVESVAMKDIQRAGRLLAEFVASLEPDFVDTIIWE